MGGNIMLKDIENINVLHKNRLDSRAYFIPYGSLDFGNPDR